LQGPAISLQTATKDNWHTQWWAISHVAKQKILSKDCAPENNSVNCLVLPIILVTSTHQAQNGGVPQVKNIGDWRKYPRCEERRLPIHHFGQRRANNSQFFLVFFHVLHLVYPWNTAS